MGTCASSTISPQPEPKGPGADSNLTATMAPHWQASTKIKNSATTTGSASESESDSESLLPPTPANSKKFTWDHSPRRVSKALHHMNDHNKEFVFLPTSGGHWHSSFAQPPVAIVDPHLQKLKHLPTPPDYYGNTLLLRQNFLRPAERKFFLCHGWNR